ncbi:MAG: phosphoserine phosphatase SerB [Paracoccaceae bacterium]
MDVTLVLTAPPGALDSHLAEAMRGAAGGGPLRWLARGRAAEFAAPAAPDLAHWRAQAPGVDVNALPRQGRRKRVLLADMDSTMIGQECIDELADLAGHGPRVAEITARAMAGEVGFDDALRARVALLEGLPETAIDEALSTRIVDAPGGRTLVATMRRHGARAWLVSGGFTAFAGPVAERLGFDRHRANVLEVADGRLTGRVVPPILGRDAKVEALDAACRVAGVGRADALAIGDGANDLGMIHTAGLGVAMHAKPVVAEQAPARIDHADLTAALFLQGYAEEEFA